MSNRSLILNRIKDKPRSRKDIADWIHLTPAAVTILVNELIEQGCLRESGLKAESTKVGRKKILIELNKTYKYVIGINIEGSGTCIGIGNLRGEVLTSLIIELDHQSPTQALIEVSNRIDQLIKRYKISKKDILGIGVGIVGVVDSNLGIAKNTYGIWPEEVNVKKILEEITGLSVVLENNVRSLALAEMDLNENRKMSNMVFIKIGPGLGSAVILNDEVYRGSNNMSGEIGHMIIGNNNKRCRCGQIGCLETVASIRGLIKSIREDYSQQEYPILYQMIAGNLVEIHEINIIEAYKQGDQGVITKVNLLIEYLSIGIVNLFKMYDPKKIIIYGSMFHDSFFLTKLTNQIKERYRIVDVENRIEQSRLGNDKCVGGMVTVIRQLFYNNGAN